MVENPTQWALSPFHVSYCLTSGVFTIQPTAVASKLAGPAGTGQDKLGVNDGIMAIVSYPDGWNIVTCAHVPYKARLDPVTKACRHLLSCSRVLIITFIDILVRFRPVN